jgi:hypothetical protein
MRGIQRYGRGLSMETRTDRAPRRYYQTTPLTGFQLGDAVRNAEHQDDAVLAIFRRRQCALTPSDVWRIGLLHGRNWLLTSVRRSITSLTEAKFGPLEKTDLLVDGPYGRPEHAWRLYVPGREA